MADNNMWTSKLTHSDVLEFLAQPAERERLIADTLSLYTFPEAANDTQKAAIELLQGKDPSGIKIAVIPVDSGTAHAASVFYAEDTVTGKKIAVGPGIIGPEAQNALEAAGITYIQGEGDAPAVKVTDFFIEAAKTRGDKATIDPSGAQRLVEGVVGAVAMTRQTENGENVSVPAGSSIGSEVMQTVGKAYLLTKKRLDITAQERQSLMRPLGIAGLPYPKVELVENEKGEYVYQLYVAQDTRRPVTVFSDRPQREVTGEMYRDMPVVAMMNLSQEIIEHTDPERDDRVLFLLGDAGWGKTHEFKKIGHMLHPDGAIVVDMGGMNAQELVWKTVIDYGQGVRELFDKRVASGQVSKESLDLLEEQFPGSVVRSETKHFETGKTETQVRINWDMVGQRRREKGADDEWHTVEDRGAAVRRAKEIMEHIYEQEKITIQENGFGVKMVKGELVEAWETGRPFFGDEFTKALPQTINTLQSLLEVANGNAESFRSYNPTPESGQKGDNDSPPFIDFNKKDMRGSFILALAGNEASDGITTHNISRSTKSRLTTLYVGDAQAVDWSHRASQTWTGLPLTTLNYIYAKAIAADPEGYAKFLTDLRKLGLKADDVAQIPAHQIEFLKKFAETGKAATQVGEFWFTEEQMAHEDAELLKQDAYKGLVDELAEKGERLGITPRKILQTYKKALFNSAKGRPVSEAVVNFNLDEVFNNLDTSVIGDTEPPWRSFGANLADAIRWDVANDTVGMKKTRAALMKLAKDMGITPADFKEADVSDTVKTLASLMKFDENADAGGTPELKDLRAIMLQAIRAKYKGVRQPDEALLPMAALARAVKEFQAKKAEDTAQTFVVANDNFDTLAKQPLLEGKAVPIYDMEDFQAAHPDYAPANINRILEGLVMPQFQDMNRAKVWPVGFIEMLNKPPVQMVKDGKPVVDDAGKPVYEPVSLEPFNIVQGMGAQGFNMSILGGVNDAGKPSWLWVIEDKTHLDKPPEPGKNDWHRYLVVGPENISNELEVKLAEQGVTYLVKQDPATKDLINKFFMTGANARSQDDKLTRDAAVATTEAIVKAFAVLRRLEEAKPGTVQDKQVIPHKATIGQLIQKTNDDKLPPSLYTNIMVQKPKGMSPG